MNGMFLKNIEKNNIPNINIRKGKSISKIQYHSMNCTK